MTGGIGFHSGQLTAVNKKVLILEAALERQDFRPGLSVADQVVTATTQLLYELLRDPATDAELTASLQVYRNAAFAFRRLAGANEEESTVALASACATLIEQGHDHFQRFTRGLGPGKQP